MKHILSIVLFFCPLFLTATDSLRTLEAVRILAAPHIDGILDDSCWKHAAIADRFTQRELHPGIPSEMNTEVKIIYDDDAIYIGANLYDARPDSILKELGTRDTEPNADLFGIFLDTYNDDINAYGFFVTAAGTQIDGRYSSDGQDFDWNAVWMSAVTIHENGWSVEFKIPYSALRFAAAEEQVWGINIIRKIRRLRENSFWNPIDPRLNALIRQCGNLIGLKNIKAPLRLSFTPYIAASINHYPGKNDGVKNLHSGISGGMDIKYGLSESFTLDMTLVPDFSQVQSDNQVLNLSPFEVQFQERRSFFTEGTELFNKGGLFYSRRVGGQPIDYYKVNDQLKDGEYIYKNPQQTQLLNATKLSGRTNRKLGIGLFNAVSGNTYATIRDSLTGNERKILTSPLSNYNIIVLDQALKNNSFLTLINTNVTREGTYHDANVTGVAFNVNNQSNTYKINGAATMSNCFYADSTGPYTGYSGQLQWGKSGGNFLWNINTSINTDKYDPNDLGIQLLNNNMEVGLSLEYNIYKPFWKVNSLYSNVYIPYSRIYNPTAFWNFGIYGETMTTFTKRFLTVGISYNLEPVLTNDYYEPRINGRFYRYPKNYAGGFFISSDYRKPFALDIKIGYRDFEEYSRKTLDLFISPRYRANNKLSFIYEISRLYKNDDIGFVSHNDTTDAISFGRRDLRTISNTLSSVYKFTNRMSLSFRIRHYWSGANYHQYYILEKDGSLTPHTQYNEEHNVNFNAFNIDMVYFWQFAPGSELNIVWKDAVLHRETEISNDYLENFNRSLSVAQNNLLSVKLLFYIDYLYLKKASQRL